MFNIAYLPFSPCPVLLLICPILTAMPAQAVQLGPGQPRVLPQVVSVVLRIVDRGPLVVKLHLKVVLAPHRIVLHHIVLDTRVTFLHFDPSESRIGIPLASLDIDNLPRRLPRTDWASDEAPTVWTILLWTQMLNKRANVTFKCSMVWCNQQAIM